MAANGENLEYKWTVDNEELVRAYEDAEGRAREAERAMVEMGRAGDDAGKKTEMSMTRAISTTSDLIQKAETLRRAWNVVNGAVSRTDESLGRVRLALDSGLLDKLRIVGGGLSLAGAGLNFAGAAGDINDGNYGSAAVNYGQGVGYSSVASRLLGGTFGGGAAAGAGVGLAGMALAARYKMEKFFYGDVASRLPEWGARERSRQDAIRGALDDSKDLGDDDAVRHARARTFQIAYDSDLVSEQVSELAGASRGVLNQPGQLPLAFDVAEQVARIPGQSMANAKFLASTSSSILAGAGGAFSAEEAVALSHQLAGTVQNPELFRGSLRQFLNFVPGQADRRGAALTYLGAADAIGQTGAEGEIFKQLLKSVELAKAGDLTAEQKQHLQMASPSQRAALEETLRGQNTDPRTRSDILRGLILDPNDRAREFLTEDSLRVLDGLQGRGIGASTMERYAGLDFSVSSIRDSRLSAMSPIDRMEMEALIDEERRFFDDRKGSFGLLADSMEMKAESALKNVGLPDFIAEKVAPVARVPVTAGVAGTEWKPFESWVADSITGSGVEERRSNANETAAETRVKLEISVSAPEGFEASVNSVPGSPD